MKMKKRTTTKKVSKRSSSKTKKTSTRKTTKKSTLPKVKKTSVPRLPTPPPLIKIPRTSGEANKPLVIGLISLAAVAIIVLFFFLAKSDFVGKAIFVGDEGEVGFVAVSDLPFNDEGVQYLQTKINEHWGYHNYIVIGATIPEGKESVGVEISIDLGELKLKSMDFSDDECNDAVESQLGMDGDGVWGDHFLKCELSGGPGEKILTFTHATLDFMNPVSGDFDIVKLYLADEDSIVGDSEEYEIKIQSEQV